jgi:hypothetical protein
MQISQMESGVKWQRVCSRKKENGDEIKDAIKLEEARRAAAVKNLYRLRSLRLSRDQAGTPKREE